ncbi:hypothetical protein B0H14DRAFT_3452628 [Mycena olivaceomarginata]|nr:hypothetical protein B0H14DRAFT_3452628 [Mycena olivaceomarginata]
MSHIPPAIDGVTAAYLPILPRIFLSTSLITSKQSTSQGPCHCCPHGCHGCFLSPLPRPRLIFFQHFGAAPPIAFAHIFPGQVLTKGGSHVELGWLFAPLAWVLGYIKRVFSFTLVRAFSLFFQSRTCVSCTSTNAPSTCSTASSTPFEPARGVFIRGQLGDIVSSYVFTDHEVQLDDAISPTANKVGVSHGVRTRGYGGSDASVAGFIAYTEKVLAAIP